MGKRVILAGILAGVGMFVWSTIAHVALPLGEAGVKRVPNEPSLLGPMRATLGDAGGFYIFPSADAGGNMQEYEKTLASSPSGVLIYHPPGYPLAFGRRLTVQLLSQLLEAFLAVFLLTQARIRSFGGRVFFVTVVGIAAACSTNLEYWNWYGFPSIYEAGYMTAQIVGFAVAGLIAAWLIKPPAPLSAA
jgi:hypothetical protein